MCGLNWGKIKVCGVKMETRCPPAFAVFFSCWKAVRFMDFPKDLFAIFGGSVAVLCAREDIGMIPIS